MRPKEINRENRTIGIITTSTPIDQLSEKQIAKAYSYLKSKGFNIKESLICKKREEFLCGSIEDRVKHIHDFVVDENIQRGFL